MFSLWWCALSWSRFKSKLADDNNNSIATIVNLVVVDVFSFFTCLLPFYHGWYLLNKVLLEAYLDRLGMIGSAIPPCDKPLCPCHFHSTLCPVQMTLVAFSVSESAPAFHCCMNTSSIFPIGPTCSQRVLESYTKNGFLNTKGMESYDHRQPKE